AKINPLLGEAVGRLRAGTVIRQAGYDGEYGVIRLFEEGELDRLARGDLLFEAPRRRRACVRNTSAPKVTATQEPPDPLALQSSGRTGVLAALDADQARAAEATDGPLIIMAGPGSGKTPILTHPLP